VIEDSDYPDWVAYEPELVPPRELMAFEGIDVLEEWFRWGEEWSVLLRALGGLEASSSVLEIGCGLGRIAFPLRYVVTNGSYEGFEIVRQKIDFLQRVFTPRHPTFRFTWADVENTHYNPGGSTPASAYRFPYEDDSFDLVFAASVFTHMAPANVAHYLAESARVLRPNGRCLCSFFLLDNFGTGRKRPVPFAKPDFDFVEAHGHEEGFGTVHPDDPERMTAYRVSLLERLARDAGLELARPPFPGYWSGATGAWIGTQDLVLLMHGGSRRSFRTLLRR
jgi:SAM-dependent methyltransferase